MGVLNNGDQAYIERAVGNQLRKWVLVTVAAFSLQAFGIVWWASSLSSSVARNTERVAKIESDRYSADDANRDLVLRDERIKHVVKAQDRIETTLASMAASMSQVSSSVAAIAARVSSQQLKVSRDTKASQE